MYLVETLFDDFKSWNLITTSNLPICSNDDTCASMLTIARLSISTDELRQWDKSSCYLTVEDFGRHPELSRIVTVRWQLTSKSFQADCFFLSFISACCYDYLQFFLLLFADNSLKHFTVSTAAPLLTLYCIRKYIITCTSISTVAIWRAFFKTVNQFAHFSLQQETCLLHESFTIYVMSWNTLHYIFVIYDKW